MIIVSSEDKERNSIYIKMVFFHRKIWRYEILLLFLRTNTIKEEVDQIFGIDINTDSIINIIN